MHKKQVITEGTGAAGKALILIHGRGGAAADMLSLAGHLSVSDFKLVAPQATNNTWYPYSFLAPPAQNEPWLSSALDLLKQVVDDLNNEGFANENIYFAGFSQGACLTLEFVTRNATRYGGIVAFTGGLIGDKIYPGNYKGDFAGTPVFIGSGNPDAHVPVERVYATANILRDKNANVVEKLYANRPHTIIEDEITQANNIVFAAFVPPAS
ncbi:alpha/beta hydrolase [Filimonas effusa]|uniref:Phospholipase n=1 Tax=Filimonas effusa TaxID=2508721 RepID=A0A4Q1D7N3_9BACT|nr:dienelactone hydrolase family protein [Filimonas effusa]RXK83717.1 phospholipase [Filimonas effusa]